MFVLLVLVVTASVHLSEELQVFGYLRNGALIPFEVSINENFATAVSGQPIPPQSFFRQSVNLYDFRKKLEARKVIQDGACYVREFKGTLEQFTKMLDDTKMSRRRLTGHVAEDWNYRGLELKGDNLESTVGPLIKAFCSDYKMYSVVKIRSGARPSGFRRIKRQLTYDQSSNERKNTGWNWWGFNRRNSFGWWFSRLFNRQNDTDENWGNGWYSRENVDRDQDGRPTGFGSGTVGYRSNHFHGNLTSGNSRERGQFVGGSLDYRSNTLNATGELGLTERGGLQGRGHLNYENDGIQGNMTVEYDENRFSASAGFTFEFGR